MKQLVPWVFLFTSLATWPALGAELDPTELFERASPSIVVVNGLNSAGSPIMQGSGVVIDVGTVISNCHVFKGAKSAEVRYAGRAYGATLLHADPKRDLCSFTVPRLVAPPATLGSALRMKVGARVFAIGAPQGFDLTLSDGLISGLRPITGGSMLQVTTAISPGSSGGGLFDAQGALIGITTMYFKDSQQINFAVPVDWINELPGRDALTRETPASGSRAAAAASAQAAYAQAIQVATDEVIAYTVQLGEKDPKLFDRTFEYLKPEIARIQIDSAPAQWPALVRAAFEKAMPLFVDRPKQEMNSSSLYQTYGNSVARAANEKAVSDATSAVVAYTKRLRAQDPETFDRAFEYLTPSIRRIQRDNAPSLWPILVKAEFEAVMPLLRRNP